MKCCEESDCCLQETAAGNTPEILKDNDGCCVVHIEEASVQNFVLPVIGASAEKIKMHFNVSVLPAELFSGNSFTPLTEKFKTSNIYLTVSNLRI